MAANTTLTIAYVSDYDTSDGTTDFDSINVEKFSQASIEVDCDSLDSDEGFIEVQGRNNENSDWETLVDTGGNTAQLGVANVDGNNILILDIVPTKFLRVHWEDYTVSSGTFDINIHLKGTK